MSSDSKLPSGNDLQQQIVDRVDAIIQESERSSQPLEVEPARGRLFELFVMADAADCLRDDADPDLSADGLCAALAARWGLKSAAESSVREQTAIPPQHLSRMRSLWSVLRMWMEWTYAWERWREFHTGESDRRD